MHVYNKGILLQWDPWSSLTHHCLKKFTPDWKPLLPKHFSCLKTLMVSLCAPGWVTSSLFASVSSSIKWGLYPHPPPGSFVSIQWMNTCKALRMLPDTAKHKMICCWDHARGTSESRETVASSLGWKECGKLQNSSAKQERGKEVNGTKKKILLSASVKNLLKVLAHTSSFLSVSQ